MSSRKREVGKVTQIEPGSLSSHFSEWMRQPTAPHQVIEESSAKWRHQKHQCVPTAGHSWSPQRCQQVTVNLGHAPRTGGQRLPLCFAVPKTCPKGSRPQTPWPSVGIIMMTRILIILTLQDLCSLIVWRWPFTASAELAEARVRALSAAASFPTESSKNGQERFVPKALIQSFKFIIQGLNQSFCTWHTLLHPSPNTKEAACLQHELVSQCEFDIFTPITASNYAKNTVTMKGKVKRRGDDFFLHKPLLCSFYNTLWAVKAHSPSSCARTVRERWGIVSAASKHPLCRKEKSTWEMKHLPKLPVIWLTVYCKWEEIRLH